MEDKSNLAGILAACCIGPQQQRLYRAQKPAIELPIPRNSHAFTAFKIETEAVSAIGEYHFNPHRGLEQKSGLKKDVLGLSAALFGTVGSIMSHRYNRAGKDFSCAIVIPLKEQQAKDVWARHQQYQKSSRQGDFW